jgi:hypothetical protein
MRVDPKVLESLSFAARAVLADVPIHDVNVVDLPGGGAGRTITDVRALHAPGTLISANPVVRALFALRWFLGHRLGWDAKAPAQKSGSFLDRVPEETRLRSVRPPGSADGPFRLLYILEREALAEIQNATVHAFLLSLLVERPGGYRLYWVVYVKATSWVTHVYMALIEPLRRFVVYPALLREIRRAWQDYYTEPP